MGSPRPQVGTHHHHRLPLTVVALDAYLLGRWLRTR
ncbi:Protein of unknown function [Propionibacterium freudenreichii]|nr:Protein of unknown function [Propionibacterium freudenreichii]